MTWLLAVNLLHMVRLKYMYTELLEDYIDLLPIKQE